MPRLARHTGLEVVLAVGMILSACGSSTPTPRASGSAVFNSGGLVLEYPASWMLFQYEMATPPSTFVSYLATVPVGDPCTRTKDSVSCGNPPYALAPGTLVVEILAADGMNELDLTLMPLTIGGMPASFRVEPYGQDRRRLVWEVARSSRSSFRITADLRGPGLDTIQAQVAAVVEGLAFNPPPVPLPTDPDELAAEAAGALVVALNALRIYSPEAACFSPVPGEARNAVVVISGRPGPQTAVPVVCSSRVEASRLQMWKVILTIQLDEPTKDLGLVVFTQWVTADGQAGDSEELISP
jgi:hypothetical protein